MRTKIRLTLIVMLTLGLAACQKTDQTVPMKQPRPVKTIKVGVEETGGVRHFPGRIEASQRVELSFRVPGRVHRLPVREGDEVEKDQVIAELDPKDFELVVNDRQAKFAEAKSNYKRAKELVKKGFLSRVDFDRVEANYKSSKTTLEQAETELSYTVLRAPFASSVTKRFIQKHQDVKAKQPIVYLGTTERLDVKFDVPEKVMMWIQDAEDGEQQTEPEVLAAFEGAQEQQFPLEFKEIATKADSKTQSFEVTYTMSAPKELNILPGMTAKVSVDLSGYLQEQPAFMLPATAVVADANLKATVWVVDEATMTLVSRQVEVGRLSGNQIEVLRGLQSGERVVVAGVPFLSVGMKVWLLPDKEQAIERGDDETAAPSHSQS